MAIPIIRKSKSYHYIEFLQCTKYHAKCFYMYYPIHASQKPVRQMLSSFSFYRQGNKATERFKNLSVIKQLVRGEVGVWNKVISLYGGFSSLVLNALEFLLVLSEEKNSKFWY